MKDVIEDDASDGGSDDHARREFLFSLPTQFLVGGQAELDLGMDPDLALAMGEEDLVRGRINADLVIAVLAVFPLLADAADRQVVRPHDDILGRADDRVAVRRAEDVVRGHHQGHGLDLGLDGERQVNGHLVAVEVGVEPLANQRVNPDRVPFDEHRLERLDAHSVQSGSPVQKDRVVADDLL